MINNMFDSINLLEKGLDSSWLRNQVIVNNIANEERKPFDATWKKFMKMMTSWLSPEDGAAPKSSGGGGLGILGTVVGSIASDDVIETIAGTINCGCTGKSKILDMVAKRVADTGLYEVRSSRGRCFSDHITNAVDDVGVVARTTNQGVSTSSPIQNVVTAVAGNDVIEAVTRTVNHGGTGESKILQVGTERPGEARLD